MVFFRKLFYRSEECLNVMGYLSDKFFFLPLFNEKCKGDGILVDVKSEVCDLFTHGCDPP